MRFSYCIIPLVLIFSFFNFSRVQADDLEDLAASESANAGKKVQYKANIEINFEGVDVEGEIKKPTGSFLSERKKSKFSPLIKFRQDFDSEMFQTVHEIK